MLRRKKKFVPLSKLNEIFKKYIVKKFHSHRDTVCIIGIDKNEEGLVLKDDLLDCAICLGLRDIEGSGVFDISVLDICQEHAVELGLIW